jgi:REP element-mobilizing transposase RayT
MVRGLERRVIFRDDADRTDFLGRLAAVVERGALSVYAWALLPNHAHLLVRTGMRPLARSMRGLLTGYAGAFNRRHHRIGHLFQNRYKPIVVEEEPYLLELVRYLHLNPLRARVLPDLATLDRYPWTGHSALLGTIPRPWQETATILAHFAPTRRRARHAYRTFVADGIPQGRRSELQGGGLVRSLGGWRAVVTLRRGREAYQGDERILGSSAFVAQLQRMEEEQGGSGSSMTTLEAVVARVCRHVGILPAHLEVGNRRPAATRARDGIAYLWTEVLGHPGRPLAGVLGVRPQAVYQAVARGRAARGEWDPLVRE